MVNKCLFVVTGFGYFSCVASLRRLASNWILYEMLGTICSRRPVSRNYSWYPDACKPSRHRLEILFLQISSFLEIPVKVPKCS